MKLFLTQTAAVALVAAVVAVFPAGAAQAGDAKALYEKNGCVACHGIGFKVAKKMVTNYVAVAEKYAKDKKAAGKLVAKIRKGGAGSFGAVPMPPQTVSEADAKALAEWVLKQK